MSLPTTRLTITVAEYRLLKQGLDVLACGLAETKLGLYPHRHPWDRIDLVASDVYRALRCSRPLRPTLVLPEALGRCVQLHEQHSL
jgi:hypothetical protein